MGTSIPHGAYARESRFHVTQHGYEPNSKNCRPGAFEYLEVLQIHDPPAGQHPIIVHHWHTDSRSTFFEFDSLNDAKQAWQDCRADLRTCDERLSANPKRKRRIECGINHHPWFYSTSDQLPTGDLVPA